MALALFALLSYIKFTNISVFAILYCIHIILWPSFHVIKCRLRAGNFQMTCQEPKTHSIAIPGI